MPRGDDYVAVQVLNVHHELLGSVGVILVSHVVQYWLKLFSLIFELHVICELVYDLFSQVVVFRPFANFVDLLLVLLD